MQILVATLCDTAVESQGKLNVIGAFDGISAPGFPANFSFTLALRFCFTSEDHGSHRFAIRLVEGSAAPSGNAAEEVEMSVNMPTDAAGFSTQNIIEPLQGTVKAAGIYYFHVTFDGNVLARVPLRVISQADTQAAPDKGA
jgi:hypothetical protein